MKKATKLLLIVTFIVILLVTLTGCTKENKNNENYKIVTSFYPVYIMTYNITDGASNVELDNMADANVRMCSQLYTSNNRFKKSRKSRYVYSKWIRNRKLYG